MIQTLKMLSAAPSNFCPFSLASCCFEVSSPLPLHTFTLLPLQTVTSPVATNLPAVTTQTREFLARGHFSDSRPLAHSQCSKSQTLDLPAHGHCTARPPCTRPLHNLLTSTRCNGLCSNLDAIHHSQTVETPLANKPRLLQA